MQNILGLQFIGIKLFVQLKKHNYCAWNMEPSSNWHCPVIGMSTPL